jgi:hypothetical protein
MGGVGSRAACAWLKKKKKKIVRNARAHEPGSLSRSEINDEDLLVISAALMKGSSPLQLQ